MKIKKILPIVMLGAALLASACSKATAENYAKVQSGMTHDEVHAILGKPDETSGGSLGGLTLSTEKWKGSKETITLTFTGERLAVKSIEPNTKE